MTPSKKSIHKINAQIARIDCLDKRLIVNLREYLEKKGVLVVVNRTASLPIDYHIVCGKASFVKKIFAGVKTTHERRLAIMFLDESEQAQNISQACNCKVWIAKNDLPSSRISEEMFAFMAENKAQISSDSSNIFSEPLETKPVETKVVRSFEISEDAEAARVSRAIESVFGNVPKKKWNIFYENLGLKKINKNLEPPKKNSVSTVLSPRKPFPSRFQKRFLFVISLITNLASAILFLGFFSIFWYILNIVVGTGALLYGQRLLTEAGQKKIISTMIQVNSFTTQQADGVIAVWEIPLSWIGAGEKLRSEENYVLFMSDMKIVLSRVATLRQESHQLMSLLLQIGSPDHVGVGDIAIKIENIKRQIVGLENALALGEGRLERLLIKKPILFRIPALAKRAENLSDKLARGHNMLLMANNLLLLYPELSGFRQRKTYLIIFQNNMELRPTGGFIGSLALASLFEGRLADINIQDVYVVDGQLKGHVDPPLPLRELMGSEHWYLRDANWDPDFRMSAKQIAWFYQKETGVVVDGVIAVNLPFILDLLRLTGPVDLPDYKDQINSDNFFNKSLTYVQKDFFPGSTQKKDFLGSLTGALLAKFAVGSWEAVPKAVSAALDRKDILLYFNDLEAQRIVESLKWAGQLIPVGGCEGSGSCFSDALSAVEANLGVNKVNYYIRRSEHIAIDFDSSGAETISETLTYKNDSLGDTLGGGTYLNYLRLFVPADAALSEVKLDGVTLPLRDYQASVPTLPYVGVESNYPGFMVYVVVMTVSSKEQREVVISYTRNKKLPESKGLYTLALGSQPGWGSTPRDLFIRYPSTWKARVLPLALSSSAERLIAKDGFIGYNTDSARSQTIQVQFVRK